MNSDTELWKQVLASSELCHKIIRTLNLEHVSHALLGLGFVHQLFHFSLKATALSGPGRLRCTCFILKTPEGEWGYRPWDYRALDVLLWANSEQICVDHHLSMWSISSRQHQIEWSFTKTTPTTPKDSDVYADLCHSLDIMFQKKKLCSTLPHAFSMAKQVRL